MGGGAGAAEAVAVEAVAVEAVAVEAEEAEEAEAVAIFVPFLTILSYLCVDTTYINKKNNTTLFATLGICTRECVSMVFDTVLTI